MGIKLKEPGEHRVQSPLLMSGYRSKFSELWNVSFDLFNGNISEQSKKLFTF